MPIIAVEGPDKCGKTTLYNALMATLPARYINFPSYGTSETGDLALRDLEEWEELYIPHELVVSRRHVIVSDAVYSELYSRPRLRCSWLHEHLRVLYIDVPIQALEARHRATGEKVQDAKGYARVKELYEAIIQEFPHVRVLPSDTVEQVAAKVRSIL